MPKISVLIGLCIIVVVFVCLVTLTLHTGRNQELRRRLATITNTTKVKNSTTVRHTNNTRGIVLLWTPFFGTYDYLPSTKKMQCQFQDCLITSKRSLLKQSLIIVFHFLDTSMTDLPNFRSPDQVWVLFVLESPLHTGTLEQFNGIFNWTATYRMDSDIWTPYDHIKKLNKNEANLIKVENYAEGKTKPAAWFTSNCHTSGNREDFVKELQKTVAVDIYGSCGTFECSPKMSFECYHKVAKQYFFYLSFENSICKDYVTEKFFHILKTNMVPVVFGGADYKAISPPNSFIDALSFESPEDLGEYLKLVSQNETLYNSYFDWRRTHGFGGYHWVCKLCSSVQRMLSGDSNKIKVYTDLQSWWKEEANCRSWSLKGFKDEK